MKYNKMNRRMFLVGTGHTLFTIPLLTSLLPKEAFAQAMSPTRFIMFTNGNAPNERCFFGNYFAAPPTLAPMTGNILNPTIQYAPLKNMAGDVSYILAPLTAHKDQMNLYRGIDPVCGENGAHPPGYPSAASGYALVPGRHTAAAQLSMDVVIANKLKKAGTPDNAKMLNLFPYYRGGISSAQTWNTREDSATYDLNPLANNDLARRVVRREATVYTKSIISRFFANLGPAPADGINRESLLNLVAEDYNRLRSNPKLGSDDKNKLDAYMALVADMEADERNPASSTCAMPTLEDDFPPPTFMQNAGESAAAFRARKIAGYEKWNAEVRPTASAPLYRNQIRLIVAAFACDLTRVASISLSGIGSHAYHHSSGFFNRIETGGTEAAAYYLSQRNAAEMVNRLVTALKGYNESGKTMLDNSIVYWNQAYGCGGGHSKTNFPIVTIGGGGGKLNTGNYLDYRFTTSTGTRRGLPINNLLVSLMSVYGVTPADYEFKSGSGYGSYEGGPGDSLPAELKTLAAKRAVLPGLIKA